MEKNKQNGVWKSKIEINEKVTKKDTTVIDKLNDLLKNKSKSQNDNK